VHGARYPRFANSTRYRQRGERISSTVLTPVVIPALYALAKVRELNNYTTRKGSNVSRFYPSAN